MGAKPFETLLDQQLRDLAHAKATAEGKTLDQIIADLIEKWIGAWQPQAAAPAEPSPPPAPAESTEVPLPALPASPVASPPASPNAPPSAAPPPAPPAASPQDTAPPPSPPATPPAVPLPPSPKPPEEQTYIVKAGDSLWNIAKKVYGDGIKYGILAQANNINDARRIYAGMRLVIPKSTVSQDPRLGMLPQPGVSPKPGYPIVPDGLAQIKQVFGDFSLSELPGKPAGRVQIDPGWLKANIITIRIPALGTIQCHKLLGPVFAEVFNALQTQGLSEQLKYYGCFLSRHKMWDPRKDLSVHSWGIAIDLNADTNAVGTPGTMKLAVIRTFAEYGFYWGGNFGDPMHFQYCLSY